jgi:UDP-N-acetylmuramoyl-tripeptide--D-alanyl-D-alanine ligase
MRITAADVAHITGGLLFGPDCVAEGVSFDSRSISRGELFVAVVADRDGNDFVSHAQTAGAAFALVSRGRSISGITCVEVDDTTAALAALGRHYRGVLSTSVDGRVVGITGSAGKTSTKNLVRAVLSQRFGRVHAAAHSLNNDIGVPVTIMNAPDDADALVIEMGMRGFHEIERLCAIALPTIGVITNIGDLAQALPSDGIAILNGDDEWLPTLRERAQCDVLTFGTSESSDLVWRVESVDTFGVVTANFMYQGENATVTPALAGTHMVANAAAAVLVGIACGMDFSEACSGVGQESSEFGRMVWLSNAVGQRILDDSYNANESSMLAALRVLASSSGRRKIAVVGRMAEVADPVQAHANVAAFAQQVGIDIISLETDLYGQSAQSLDDVMRTLQNTEWDSLLVKGSRAAATERVVAALLKS